MVQARAVQFPPEPLSICSASYAAPTPFGSKHLEPSRSWPTKEARQLPRSLGGTGIPLEEHEQKPRLIGASPPVRSSYSNCQFSKRTNLAITQNLYVGLCLAYSHLLLCCPAGTAIAMPIRITSSIRLPKPLRFKLNHARPGSRMRYGTFWPPWTHKGGGFWVPDVASWQPLPRLPPPRTPAGHYVERVPQMQRYTSPCSTGRSGG